MVWMDLEMTGLSVSTESIIEIATVVTDGDLNILAQGPNLAIRVPDALLEAMDEWNTTHHHNSGLVDRIKNEGVAVEEAEEAPWRSCRNGLSRTPPPCVGTASGTIAASWRRKCPACLTSSTIAWWTSQPSKNSQVAGTPTFPAIRKRGLTWPWTIRWRASKSFATSENASSRIKIDAKLPRSGRRFCTPP